MYLTKQYVFIHFQFFSFGVKTILQGRQSGFCWVRPASSPSLGGLSVPLPPPPSPGVPHSALGLAVLSSAFGAKANKDLFLGVDSEESMRTNLSTLIPPPQKCIVPCFMYSLYTAKFALLFLMLVWNVIYSFILNSRNKTSQFLIPIVNITHVIL